MTEESPGFLSSIQGILTALTGIIAAITALYIAVNDDNSTDNDGAVATPPIVEVPPPAHTPTVTVESVITTTSAIPPTSTPVSTPVINPVTAPKQVIQNTPQVPLPQTTQTAILPVRDASIGPGPIATAAKATPSESPKLQPQTSTQFPQTGSLVDCARFPAVNTVASLLSWSKYYHKQVIAAGGINARAVGACNKTIDYRGMAHCKVPNDPEVRQALLETLTLCRKAGIEWTEIQHTTIIGK